MFVDASALAAILLQETDADIVSEKLSASGRSMTSAVAIYETALAIHRVTGRDMTVVVQRITDFLSEAEIEVIAIGLLESVSALDAFARFGKGRHPARLNMGDCFAYACARLHEAPLLFKGDDFAQTDVVAA